MRVPGTPLALSQCWLPSINISTSNSNSIFPCHPPHFLYRQTPLNSVMNQDSNSSVLGTDAHAGNQCFADFS